MEKQGGRTTVMYGTEDRLEVLRIYSLGSVSSGQAMFLRSILESWSFAPVIQTKVQRISVFHYLTGLRRRAFQDAIMDVCMLYQIP
jgi:hypothetical protein